jgi:transcriptional regulator with XRE-family HTH domain
MSELVITLLNQLITEAKKRGITQAGLAEMAGLTAVGLSKAKSRGDIRVSTLAKLAKQLDLELALVPKASKDKAVKAIKQGALFRDLTGGSSDGED